jgi:hypothetical protein
MEGEEENEGDRGRGRELKLGFSWFGPGLVLVWFGLVRSTR